MPQVGLVAYYFGAASVLVEGTRDAWIDAQQWVYWVLLPFGLPCVLLLTRVFFDGTAGSGIPLEMASFLLLDDDPNLRRIFSPRILVGKIGLTMLGQLCGASSGREGPTVQVWRTQRRLPS